MRNPTKEDIMKKLSTVLVGSLSTVLLLACTPPTPPPGTTDTTPPPTTPPPIGCTRTLTTGSNIATAVASASGGDTICLAAGSYGFANITSQKSSTVVVKPLSGATASVAGAALGSSSTPATHVHLSGLTFTSGVGIYDPGSMANADVVLDGNTLANINTAGLGGEGRVQVNGLNVNHSADSGIIIRNNTFGPNGATDGVQITGDGRGVQILDNEFKGIKESGCGPVHCDPIQFYGGTNTTISGNWFHGNSTGIMSGDGNGSPMTVQNNVFDTDGEYPDQVVLGGGSGDVVSHNTFAGGARIRIGKVNVGYSNNEVVRDNVFTGTIYLSEGQSTSSLTIDWNLAIDSTTRGPHGVNGQPTYVGGPNWSGYMLATSSPGYHAASDGLSMGIN